MSTIYFKWEKVDKTLFSTVFVDSTPRPLAFPGFLRSTSYRTEASLPPAFSRYPVPRVTQSPPSQRAGGYGRLWLPHPCIQETFVTTV